MSVEFTPDIVKRIKEYIVNAGGRLPDRTNVNAELSAIVFNFVVTRKRNTVKERLVLFMEQQEDGLFFGTHQDLAESVGTTREAISRTISANKDILSSSHSRRCVAYKRKLPRLCAAKRSPHYMYGNNILPSGRCRS